MIEDILIPFVTIVVAELGDKTQISILCLSSKTKQYLLLLTGVMLAFLIVDGIAIAAGSWVTSVVPLQTVKIASGVLFIAFGLITLLRKEKETEEKKFYSNPFLSGFLLIFLAEWGDKTQIASALFAAKYNALLVLFGTIGALFLVSVTAVYCGMFIAEHISKNALKKISAIVFIIMGIVFFF